MVAHILKYRLYSVLFENLKSNIGSNFNVCFSAVCGFFQVDDLLLIEEKIDLEVRSLETCMFDHKTFSDILNRVQKAVDDLNLYSYSNLPIWVNKLDIEVGTIIQKYRENDLIFLFGYIVTVLSWNISSYVSFYM